MHEEGVREALTVGAQLVFVPLLRPVGGKSCVAFCTEPLVCLLEY